MRGKRGMQCLLPNNKISKGTRIIGIIINSIFFLVFAILFCFYIFQMLFAVCVVDGYSMNNTLYNGDVLLLERNVRTVEINDIVSIKGMSDVLIIKRVIALEGDSLVFKQSEEDEERVDLYRSTQGQPYERLVETYILQPMSTFGWGLNNTKRLYRSEFLLAPAWIDIEEFEEYAINLLEGECFVMGDNRDSSSDSRFYGKGKVSNITGKMHYRFVKNSWLEKIILFIYN